MKWAPGEPNNIDNEDCGALWTSGQDRGTWNDYSCAIKIKAICEKSNYTATLIIIITARKRSLEQGNIFRSVCHSVHRGRVPDQVYPPLEQTPPWDQVSPGTRYRPGPGTPPWDQVHLQD